MLDYERGETLRRWLSPNRCRTGALLVGVDLVSFLAV